MPPPKKNRVSAKDFSTAARQEFGYLVNDFGFEEDTNREKVKGPRTVCYTGPTQLVTVEGIQTTSTVEVTVTVNMGPGEEPIRLPLQALVDQRAPGARLVASDMLAQLAHDAGLLRTHAADLLKAEANARAIAEKLAEQIKKKEEKELKREQEQSQGVA
jgi:hypothetical protein